MSTGSTLRCSSLPPDQHRVLRFLSIRAKSRGPYAGRYTEGITELGNRLGWETMLTDGLVEDLIQQGFVGHDDRHYRIIAGCDCKGSFRDLHPRRAPAPASGEGAGDEPEFSKAVKNLEGTTQSDNIEQTFEFRRIRRGPGRPLSPDHPKALAWYFREKTIGPLWGQGIGLNLGALEHNFAVWINEHGVKPDEIRALIDVFASRPTVIRGSLHRAFLAQAPGRLRQAKTLARTRRSAAAHNSREYWLGQA